MLIYRIALEKYAHKLVASGRAARWNPNDVEMIYAASSRSLACLENVVHRNQLGLSLAFSVMTIEVPDELPIISINKEQLPPGWQQYDQMLFTQQLGEKWIRERQSAILKVPSSIIEEEVNYLINPKQDDFKFINLIKIAPFVFDARIKQ